MTARRAAICCAKSATNVEGSADGAVGKTITQICNYDDPVRGPLKWRHVTRVVDRNHLEFEMYTSPTQDESSEQ